ncbi:MAG: DMT family transporter [Alphaproteobacteria bacterium]|nr:DMT family transporter [Alphaproteobacteria bacterium]
MPRKETLGVLIALASAAVFGFYPPATRGAYADGVNPAFIILFTTFWRTASLSLFCLGTKRPLLRKKENIKNGILNGFFQTASTVGILGAMQFLPGPVVITIVFSYTLMLYLFLVFKGEEKLNPQTLIPVFFAFIGLTLVVNVQDKLEEVSLPGLCLAFMAAIATATRVYAYGNVLKKNDPAVIGAETFIFTLLFCSLLTFYQTPLLPQSTMGWVWAGSSAAALSLGSFGMFYGISMIGAFKFSLLTKLEPISGAIFSVILIGEKLSPTQYLGMATVILSLLAYQVLQHRQAAKKTSPH